MSFLDFPGLQYFYNKYLKPIKPHAREETIKSYTVNEQGHVPDAQLVAQLKEENESLQAEVEALNSALALLSGIRSTLTNGGVEFTSRVYQAGEAYVDGTANTDRCEIMYLRIYSQSDRSLLIGTMVSTSEDDWWSKYVASGTVLVTKNIGSEWYGWVSLSSAKG